MIGYYEDVIEVIKDSIESIDAAVYEQVIEESVSVLKNGGKIIASGLGKNVPICEKFVGTLNSFGIDARFLHTNTAVHGDLQQPGFLPARLQRRGVCNQSDEDILRDILGLFPVSQIIVRNAKDICSVQSVQLIKVECFR